MSLIRELELFVDGLGFTPEETIASATIECARWFGAEHTAGTIAVGKIADVVLFDSNPLARISNLRSVRGVMIAGRYFDARQLRDRRAS